MKTEDLIALWNERGGWCSKSKFKSIGITFEHAYRLGPTLTRSVRGVGGRFVNELKDFFAAIGVEWADPK